jgi:hypothetical protein
MPENLADLQRVAIQKTIERLQAGERLEEIAALSVTSCNSNSCNTRAFAAAEAAAPAS